MGDRKLHSLVVIHSHIGNTGVGHDIVVIKNGWGAARLELLHPGILECETKDKGPDIIVLQHEHVVRYRALQLFCYRDDLHVKSGGFRHLPESDDNLIAELMRLLIVQIFYQYTELFEVRFWRRCLVYPISTAVSNTVFRNVSLMSGAPLSALETVPLDMPSFSAMSIIVAILSPFKRKLQIWNSSFFIISETYGKCNSIYETKYIKFRKRISYKMVEKHCEKYTKKWCQKCKKQKNA